MSPNECLKATLHTGTEASLAWSDSLVCMCGIGLRQIEVRSSLTAGLQVVLLKMFSFQSELILLQGTSGLMQLRYV